MTDSEITLGCNRAFSPSCAGSESAVGLLSSSERTLPFRIETAGWCFSNILGRERLGDDDARRLFEGKASVRHATLLAHN